jgi:hypothetical protein
MKASEHTTGGWAVREQFHDVNIIITTEDAKETGGPATISMLLSITASIVFRAVKMWRR